MSQPRPSSTADLPVPGLEYPWPAPPAPGTAIQVAPGIKWIRMPLPFQLNHINLWLLEDGPGWVAVDTGVGLDDTRAAWAEVFEQELGGKPITRIVVTHFHPDHMGNAAWLNKRWGAPLTCALAEWLTAQVAWGGGGGNDSDKRIAYYRNHGVAEHVLNEFRERGNHYRRLVPSVVPEFHALREGDVLRIGGREWRAFTTLGHAPEHMCLHSPAAGVLISGDQVLPKITTNISVWPDQPMANPLRLYLDSLPRFRPLPADTLVLPSHGLPFRGLHHRLDMLAHHHEERLGEATGALAEPRTATQIVPVLFRRELDTHQLGFAIGETLAHLHYLEAEGQIARTIGADHVHRFQKA